MEHFRVRLNRLLSQYKKASSFEIIDTSENDELEKVERETKGIDIQVQEKHRVARQVEEVLAEDPKQRKKLEGIKLSQKKVDRLNKKRRRIWDHIQRLRMLHDDIRRMEGTIQYNQEKMETLKESLIEKERKEGKFWEILEAIFDSHHNIFPRENELTMRYTQMGITLLKYNKKIDLFSKVRRDCHQSRECLERALEKLKKAVEKEKEDEEEKKKPKPSRGLSYFSAVDEEEDTIGYVLQNLVGDARTALHQSYQKLFNAKLYVPNEAIFQKVRRSNDTSNPDPKSVTFGNARKVMDVMKKTPRDSYGSTPFNSLKPGLLDTKKVETALALLERQRGILGLICEFVDIKQKTANKAYDDVRKSCRVVRNEIIKERRRIIDNFDQIYKKYKKSTELDFVIDRPQFLPQDPNFPNFGNMNPTQGRYVSPPIVPIVPVVDPMITNNSHNPNQNQNNNNQNQGGDGPTTFYI